MADNAEPKADAEAPTAEEGKSRRQIPGGLPYTTSPGVLKSVLQRIPTSEKPSVFTQDFLGTVMEATGGSARPVIPILKTTGLLNQSGVPTDLYAQYQTDSGRAAAALQALKNGFAEIFRRNQYAHKAEDAALSDLIVQITGLPKKDRIVGAILNTFRVFQEHARGAAASEDAPPKGDTRTTEERDTRSDPPRCRNDAPSAIGLQHQCSPSRNHECGGLQCDLPQSESEPSVTEHTIELFVLKCAVIETNLRRSLAEYGDAGSSVFDASTTEALEPFIKQFELSNRKNATKMSRYYEIFYMLENDIRRLIVETMEATHGATWWDTHVSQAVRDEAKKNMDRESHAGVTMRSDDHIDYTTFGQLGDIIRENWQDFAGMLSNLKAVNRVMSALNMLRGTIAHCGLLAEDEVDRLKLAIRDWFRVLEGPKS